jgi:predicted Mrr-cat superfamily restriction endonuclease
MKGAFICPYCKTKNACDCKSCKEYIQEGEFVITFSEDGEYMMCGKCNRPFSFDQATDEEYKTFNTNEK